MSVIDEIERELAEATGRLLATAARLTDEDVRAPSLLPGWTRGHVLAHIARNADSCVNLLVWARTGVPTPQYASAAAREAGVEAGAARPAAEQLADLEESAARFAAEMRRMPAECWSAPVSGMRPPEHPAWYVPVRRLREVEVHHVDLGAGYGWADWPEAYVRRELYDTMRWLDGRSPVSAVVARDPETGGIVRTWTDVGAGSAVEGTPGELLAWLGGRSDGDGLTHDGSLPSPPPWPETAPAGLPAAPPPTWPPADR